MGHKCCKLEKNEPTKADVIARFDRIHAKLQIVFETTNRAKEFIEQSNDNSRTSLRPIETHLIKIERVLDKL